MKEAAETALTKSEIALTVIDWLKERRENCLRILKTKPDADKEGWKQDAGYFALAVELLEQVHHRHTSDCYEAATDSAAYLTCGYKDAALERASAPPQDIKRLLDWADSVCPDCAHFDEKGMIVGCKLKAQDRDGVLEWQRVADKLATQLTHFTAEKTPPHHSGCISEAESALVAYRALKSSEPAAPQPSDYERLLSCAAQVDWSIKLYPVRDDSALSPYFAFEVIAGKDEGIGSASDLKTCYSMAVESLNELLARAAQPPVDAAPRRERHIHISECYKEINGLVQLCCGIAGYERRSGSDQRQGKERTMVNHAGTK